MSALPYQVPQRPHGQEGGDHSSLQRYCSTAHFLEIFEFSLFLRLLTMAVDQLFSSSPTSQLRCVNGQEPAAAGRVPGRAAEVGQSSGQEDSQEASTSRALCTLLTACLHEGSD